MDSNRASSDNTLVFRIDPLELQDEKTLNDPNSLHCEGANGVVNHYTLHGQPVVVKYFSPGDSADPHGDFLRELKVSWTVGSMRLYFVEPLTQLTSKNVCPVLGVTYHPRINNCPGIVLPYMENGSLRSYSRKYHKTWSLSKKIQMASDIACGLAWLDGQGTSVVHLDLKSENSTYFPKKLHYQRFTFYSIGRQIWCLQNL
eukprot:TRINITY_DN2038_c0_g1_i3.p1 TRINITY_DN2038_c0_g1~~TRINITY_DN2038_c0_g1_i3.p1  ORF type:complete len:201 (+),score=22.59 TRINITY_DN2038_c0_g1_i3:222-824(+)